MMKHPIAIFCGCAVLGFLAWPEIRAALPRGHASSASSQSYGRVPIDGLLNPLTWIGAQVQQPQQPTDRAEGYQPEYEGGSPPARRRGDFDTGGARHGCARDANPADPDDLGCGWRRGPAPGEREEPYPEIRDCGNGIRSTHCQWHRGGR